jgi:hypothetical protein
MDKSCRAAANWFDCVVVLAVWLRVDVAKKAAVYLPLFIALINVVLVADFQTTTLAETAFDGLRFVIAQ